MRKMWTVGSVGLLLLVMSACGGQQPVAKEASSSPVPSQAAASVSPPASSGPSAQPSVSAAGATAPTTSQVPSSSPAAATAASTATPKVSAAASATPTATATAPAPTEKVEANDDQAKALFKDNCMSCHGASLEGGFGPSLKKVGSQMSKTDIAAQITNGGGGMTAFEKTLDAGEIEALAAWLATKK